MSPNVGSSIIYFILLFGILYFLFIRPQQRRAKEHQELVEALKVGDFVVTMGGLTGKIAFIENEEVGLEISEGVVARIVKASISGIKGENPPRDE